MRMMEDTMTSLSRALLNRGSLGQALAARASAVEKSWIGSEKGRAKRRAAHETERARKRAEHALLRSLSSSDRDAYQARKRDEMDSRTRAYEARLERKHFEQEMWS